MNFSLSTNSVKLATSHELYFDSTTAMLSFNGQLARLDHKTFQLLCYFVAHQDQVIERKALIKELWQDQDASDASLARVISVIRKILGVNGHQFIFTIHKTGYRFVIPTDVTFIESNPIITNDTPAAAANPVPEPLTEKEPEKGTTRGPALLAHGLSLPGQWGLAFSLLFGCLFWLQQLGTKSAPELESRVAESLLTAIESSPISNRIAIVPFEPLTAQAGDERFIKGLMTELLNRLTKIDSLVVVNRHLGTDFANKTAADVRYLLKGNINKNGNQLSMTVQLLDTSSGAYLFSTVFERQLDDVFATQKELSEQVAAALKLSLVHKSDHYLVLLDTMDYVGVEQLVVARAYFKEYTQASLNRALVILQSLNRRFADTPEVLGLLAHTQVRLSSISEPGVGEQRKIEVELANKALALDPSNLNALLVLYDYYKDFASLRERAYPISEAILDYHPGTASAWRSRLSLMINSVRPCDEIQALVSSIPDGVFTGYRISVINHIIGMCLRSLPLKDIFDIKTTATPLKLQKAIYNNIYFFGLRHDLFFEALQVKVRRNAWQIHLSEAYRLQLVIGDTAGAALTAAAIKRAGHGFLTSHVALYEALYIPADIAGGDQKAIASFDLSSASFTYEAPIDVFAAILITRAQQQANSGILSDYLATTAPFPITLNNRKEALGLMMMQYHANKRSQSRKTAKKLFDKLNRYHQNHRQSFWFWGLGRDLLIAKFHCGSGCRVGDSVGNSVENSVGNDKDKSTALVFDQLFKPDHVWWTDDIAFTRLALSPWANSPVVIEYLARIEQDRQRARDKFAL
jgi:TolB-like protein/DNA-binding winged helix-turn-helix (wHTH) protein